MNDILKRLREQGQGGGSAAPSGTASAPAVDTVAAIMNTPTTNSDLAYPLQRSHSSPESGLKRLHTLTNGLAAAPNAGRKQELLLQVVDLLAEALRLEESNIGVDWREAKPEEYDTALLGQGVQLVASRLNEYAPQVLMSLLTSKCAYIEALNDDTDTRHLGYVVAAAMQVIASHQLKRDHTPATRAKQKKSRLSAGVFDKQPNEAGSGGIFDDLMAALDGPAPAGTLPDSNALLGALTNNGASDANKNEQDSDGAAASTGNAPSKRVLGARPPAETGTVVVSSGAASGSGQSVTKDPLAELIGDYDADEDDDGDDGDGFSSMDTFLS